MNNQNDKKVNQTNQSTNDQDVLNQYASLIKPDTDNDTVDGTISADNSAEDQTDLALKQFNSTPIDTPNPVSLGDSLDPSESLLEELKETKPVKEEPSVLPDEKSKAESESKPEAKPEPKIEAEMESDYQPEPIITTESEPPKTSLEDPQEIKQKIEEVLSYTSTSNNPVTDNPNQTKPPVSKFVKFLFSLSLIIFIIIVAGLGFLFLNPDYFSKQKTDLLPTPTPVPTITKSNVSCELNGFVYTQGQTFTAADGCNTCTCESADNIVCTEKDCDIQSSTSSATKSATITPAKSTTSSIPKDWKTYTDSTYKFSISYPPEWTLEEGYYDINLNKINIDIDTVMVGDWFTIKSPEGEKEEKRIKSEPPSLEGYQKPCGFYYINCYKSFDLFKKRLQVQENTLLTHIKSLDFGDFSQSTTNGQILYSVISNSLGGGREFYIQNKDTSFCYLQFCGETSSGKELTPTEKQFVNTFQFN